MNIHSFAAKYPDRSTHGEGCHCALCVVPIEELRTHILEQRAAMQELVNTFFTMPIPEPLKNRIDALLLRDLGKFAEVQVVQADS